MSMKWAVTAAAERVVLDDQRQGEMTFTVTNPTEAPDQAVFDVLPGEGADAAWFSVEDPQRLVRGGTSVSYVMKVAVPATAAAGSYPVQGLVYSADSAPEESSVLSPRVMLEIPGGAPPTRRRWPWWWLAVAAGLVVVVLATVVTLVVTRDRDGTGPAPTPSPQAQGVMPDVRGLGEAAAVALLSEHGITANPFLYRYDPERAGQVVDQWVAPGEKVDPEDGVTLEIGADLRAPVVTGPQGVIGLAPGDTAPELTWDPGRSLARRWLVTVNYEECTLAYADDVGRMVRVSCEITGPALVHGVDTHSLVPELPFPSAQVHVPGGYVTGWYQWYVEPLDDFGNRGPRSEPGYFRLEWAQS